MKITDIEIERFGVWQNLSLPLTSSGLSVCYGPNEAGKTTLMRFIRSVLYGFSTEKMTLPHDLGHQCAGSRTEPQAGRICVDEQGRLFEIRRVSEDGGRGLVTVKSRDGGELEEDGLAELLSDVAEDLFDRVFAIGLQELQELATLHNDDVARHIYGLSLGPEGQQLLEVSGEIEMERCRFLEPGGEAGELADLFGRYEQLGEQLQAVEGNREQHEQLCVNRVELEDAIAELKRRRQGIHSQLRGHVFLERVWTPWKRVCDYQEELDGTPVVEHFPAMGMAQLEEIETEKSQAAARRDELLSESSRLSREAEQLEIDPELRQHATTIQSLVDQTDWVRQWNEEGDALRADLDVRKQQLDQKLAALGSDWSLERLEAAQATPAAYYRLIDAARSYQAALARRARFKRRCQRLSQRYHQRLADLKERQQALTDLPLEDALTRARQSLVELEELGRLRLRESELAQRQIGIRDLLDRAETRLSLPVWIHGVLAFFALTGIGLAIGGIATGVTTNGIVGAIYGLLGITCGGLAWALKSHFERDAHDSVERLQADRRENQARLREAREATERLSDQAKPTALAAGDERAPTRRAASDKREPTALAAGDKRALIQPTRPEASAYGSQERPLIRQAVRHLEALEQLAQQDERLRRLRRRLTELRKRFQDCQRSVGTERHNWCQLLTQCGFAETLSVDDAFQTWQQVVDANAQYQRWSAVNAEWSILRKNLKAFRRRVEELGRRMQRWDADYAQPLVVLKQWEEELRQFAERRKERQRLRSEAEARKAEARDCQELIDEVKTRLAALLVQGGAASPSEFEQRAHWNVRRADLQQLLETARADLESVSRTEPELAIVEEDLLAYDAAQNAEAIEMLNLEQDDLEQDVQQAFEALGRVKQDIESLETDRHSTRLRFECQQVAAQLQRTAEEWLAIELAGGIVEDIRHNFERTCQPGALVAAGDHLQRLTSGRYRNIWTPLGKRRLRIDGQHDQTVPVEQLSGGTREQLFLAIRFAMVDRLRAQGLELPMVLDDVFVNFDQLRTEAAIDALIDLAERGQQVLLFTCHLHLAHLFESRGVTPTWLPGHSASLEERRAG